MQSKLTKVIDVHWKIVYETLLDNFPYINRHRLDNNHHQFWSEIYISDFDLIFFWKSALIILSIAKTKQIYILQAIGFMNEWFK